MKTIVQINSHINGSTGKIMCSIADEAIKQGYYTYNFFGRGEPKVDGRDIKFASKLSIYFHALIGRLGFNGHGSYFATKRLIKQLKSINPDIIHLHNVHGYYINIKLLFNYLKNDYKGKIIWTLHDCWSFTGHCAYFDFVNCNKWAVRCSNCPQLNHYPKTLLDTTKYEFEFKKKLFSNLNNFYLVTPSLWLSKLVKKSYLRNYDINVINYGIDTEIFRFYSKTETEELYDKYNLPGDKKIILGVANVWEERKGLKDFIELASVLDNKYQIVLVGIDDKNKANLPHNIISISRTDNQIELAKLYSISYVFYNPTYEDNFPTVNLESISCGTPVITYNTGGSPEIIGENGCVTNKEEFLSDFSNVLKSIKKNKTTTNNNLSSIKMVKEYIELYK